MHWIYGQFLIRYRSGQENRYRELDQCCYSPALYIFAGFLRGFTGQMDSPSLFEYLLHARHLLHGGKLIAPTVIVLY